MNEEIMEPPLLVTSAIITKEDKFLLAKRAREPFKGHWSFIGGCGSFLKVSDPKDAIIDEVTNDIACTFKPTFFNYYYETFTGPTVKLVFNGTITGEITVDPTYNSEAKWFTYEEAMQEELGFGGNNILTQFVQQQEEKCQK